MVQFGIGVNSLGITGGQHGTDEAMKVAGKILGQVMGVVFQRPGYKTVYLAGDTIWNASVEDSIKQYQPDVIILNSGYARIQGLEGSIMTLVGMLATKKLSVQAWRCTARHPSPRKQASASITTFVCRFRAS